MYLFILAAAVVADGCGIGAVICFIVVETAAVVVLSLGLVGVLAASVVIVVADCITDSNSAKAQH